MGTRHAVASVSIISGWALMMIGCDRRIENIAAPPAVLAVASPGDSENNPIILPKGLNVDVDLWKASQAIPPTDVQNLLGKYIRMIYFNEHCGIRMDSNGVYISYSHELDGMDLSGQWSERYYWSPAFYSELPKSDTEHPANVTGISRHWMIGKLVELDGIKKRLTMIDCRVTDKVPESEQPH